MPPCAATVCERVGNTFDSTATFWGGVARANTSLGERTVVVGYRGAVRVSADRQHWTGSQMAPFPGNLYMNDVTFGDATFVAVGDKNVRASARENLRNGRPNTGSGPRDERDFIVESEHGRMLNHEDATRPSSSHPRASSRIRAFPF